MAPHTASHTGLTHSRAVCSSLEPLSRKGDRQIIAHPENGPPIWIIDAEHWPRAYMVAELQERGYDATGFITMLDAIAALRSKRPRPKGIVLELRGQKLARVEIESLVQSRIPLVVIGGQIEFNEPLLKHFKFGASLVRPVSIGEVADTVERCIAKET